MTELGINKHAMLSITQDKKLYIHGKFIADDVPSIEWLAAAVKEKLDRDPKPINCPDCGVFFYPNHRNRLYCLDCSTGAVRQRRHIKLRGRHYE